MELTVQLGDHAQDGDFDFLIQQQSDIGNRSENQDALAHRWSGDWLVCVLADGAGGHLGGEVASSQAVNLFMNLFFQQPGLDAGLLSNAVHQVNRSLLQAQQSSPQLQDMHTTLCGLVLNRRLGLAAWFHVGDSRVYHFSNSQLVSRTADHSVLQWMKDTGQAGPAPVRNALYTALGEQAEHLKVDVSAAHPIAPGDWFLLCSDGLWEHFSDEELGLLGSNLRRDTGCARHLHQLAESRAAGRADNFSSILVFVESRVHSSG